MEYLKSIPIDESSINNKPTKFKRAKDYQRSEIRQISFGAKYPTKKKFINSPIFFRSYKAEWFN